MAHRLSKDIGLQVLSALLAVVLWVQAAAVQNPVDRFTIDGIPVTYAGVPKGTVVAESLQPAKVSVIVKCRWRVGEKLSSADFAAKVALENGRAGSFDYLVEMVAPAGVEIVEVSPATVTANLERAASVKAPVEARLLGSPAEGFATGAMTVNPAEVTVFGAASATSRVAKIVAEFDITAATGDKSGKGDLMAVDSTGAMIGGVSFSPGDVTVAVSVVALPPAESIDVDVALTGSPADGYAVLQITSSPARVQVRPAVGQNIDFTHVLTEPVDISGATSDVHATVPVVLAPGVASVVPAQVDVVVMVGASRSFAEMPVAVRNTPVGLSGSADPAVVDIVVRGPRGILDRLTAGDLVAWVDAAGRPLGESPVKVNVTLPDWAQGLVEVASVTPSDLTLTIQR